MSLFSGLELRSVSINTFVQFVVRIIGSTATLATTLLITYFLGLDAVGSFTKVVAFVSIFYLIVDFGFNSVLLKNYYNSTQKYIGNLVVLRLLISCSLLPVILVLAFLLPYDSQTLTGFSSIEKASIAIFSLTLIALSLTTTLQAFMQRKLSYGLSVLPSFIASITLVILVLLAILWGNFYLLFTAYIFSTSVMAVLTYISLKRAHGLSLKVNNLIPFSRQIIFATWPIGLMLFFNFLYSRADVFFLAFFKPSSDVGIYGVSYRFFEVAIALPTFLANSTYPLLLKLRNSNTKYNDIFSRYLKLYFVIAIAVTGTVLLLSPLLGFIKGTFQPSVIPLQILSLSLPFFFLTGLLQWHFLIRNKLLFLVPLYASALGLNVILNIIFVPQFSYIASAVITGICEALVFGIMLWYFIHTSRKPRDVVRG